MFNEEKSQLLINLKRSELAIKYGVDLVIELPFAYVNQSADYFCKGAIDLLYHIGITDLVFGSECGDIDTLKKLPMLLKIILMNMINMSKMQ